MTSHVPPAPGGGGWYPPPKHPQAVLVLVLGIVGLVVCGIAAPFAWIMGNRVVREIDAEPQRYTGRSEANAGRILGIIGSVILALSLLVLAVMVFFVVVGAMMSTSAGS